MSAGWTLAGIVGWPIEHSLSPLLHARWLAEYHIAGSYIPVALRREDLSAGLDGLRRAGFVGTNVTVPHKEAAFALAERLDEPARLCGAANLLLFQEGRVEGRNTDASGLAKSLIHELGEECVKGGTALVLGAGGAARAAILALDTIGARDIFIFNRTASRGQFILQQMKSGVRARLHLAFPQEINRAMETTSLLVNATSGGMKGSSDLNFSLDKLPQTAAVCDLVYNPLETGLIRAARERQIRAINGLGMLMNQAADAFAAFFGVKPVITPTLRAGLERALAP